MCTKEELRDDLLHFVDPSRIVSGKLMEAIFGVELSQATVQAWLDAEGLDFDVVEGDGTVYRFNRR
jgi:hypothetical protein